MGNHYIEITPEISYLTGLWQTDGHISEDTRNRGRATIELSNKDADVIYKLSQHIKDNYNISVRQRNIQLKGRLYIKSFISLKVYNKDFRHFLISLGVPVGKKSDIIEPSIYIPKSYEIDYIRGLYDGDGSLGFTVKNIPFISFITKSEVMATYIVEFIHNITQTPIKKLTRNKRDNAYNITIFNEDAQTICNILYYNECLAINRKKELANKIREWTRPLDIKKKPPKIFWTDDEVSFIKSHDINESLIKLKRTEKSIKMKLRTLNILQH